MYIIGSARKFFRRKPIKQSIIKICLFCKRQGLQYYSYTVLIVYNKMLFSYVFYVYRPMLFCKRHEVALCIMADVAGRELALYRTHPP